LKIEFKNTDAFVKHIVGEIFLHFKNQNFRFSVNYIFGELLDTFFHHKIHQTPASGRHAGKIFQ
jgi:hypothetical protein